MKQKTLRFLLVTLTMLLCFLCAACGGDSGDNGSGSNVPPNEDTVYDLSVYEGVWQGDANNLYDACIIEFDEEGNWLFYIGGDLVDEGDLQYDPEREAVCVRSSRGGAIEGGSVELENGRLSIDTCGYFDVFDGTEDDWYSDTENGGYTYNGDYNDNGGYNYNGDYNDNGGYNYNGDYDYNGDYGVYHRDISEFQGTWYLDNDLAAVLFIVIDGDGSWSYYERTPGDPEATEMDHGILCCSADESGVYYADSAVYDELSFRVYELDEDVFLWDDEYTFYRMER